MFIHFLTFNFRLYIYHFSHYFPFFLACVFTLAGLEQPFSGSGSGEALWRMAKTTLNDFK